MLEERSVIPIDFSKDNSPGCLNEVDPNYDPNQKREEYIALMEEQGYMIVLPAPDELQVDMDTEEHYSLFRKQMKSLILKYPDISVDTYPSRNGLPGRHAVIKMPFVMTDAERIAWQAALGSDPFREIMSLFRLRNGDVNPTLFVEKKIKEE